MNVATQLPQHEVFQALLSAFPGAELAGRPAVDEEGAPIDGAFDIEFHDDAPPSADQVNVALTAWTAGALDRIKSARITELQDRRAVAVVDFTFAGHSLQLTVETQSTIGNTVQALARQPDGTTVDWEFDDGVYEALALPQMQAMGDAGFLHVQACFTNSAAITAAVMAAGTPEAVAAVDIDAGWPTE